MAQGEESGISSCGVVIGVGVQGGEHEMAVLGVRDGEAVGWGGPVV